jgi:hypothetical protein
VTSPNPPSFPSIFKGTGPIHPLRSLALQGCPPPLSFTLQIVDVSAPGRRFDFRPER